VIYLYHCEKEKRENGGGEKASESNSSRALDAGFRWGFCALRVGAKKKPQSLVP